MNKIFYLGMIFFGLSVMMGCGRNANMKMQSDHKFVIISSTNTEASSFVIGLGVGNLPFWNPTTENLVVLELSLREFLKSHPPKKNKPVELNDYSFQYFGCTREDKRVVFINAFCGNLAEQHPEWKERIVFVQDGGSCYFQAFFDVEKQEIIDIHYNGEA